MRETMQKIVKIFLLILVLALVLAAVFLFAHRLTGPKIQAETLEYNFGDIPRQKVEKTLWIKNIGSAPLEIRRVSTSCGCTKAAIDKTMIEPGQTANLTITFDPTEMEEIGPVEKIVYIRSNDPLNDETAITIKMYVVKDKF